MVKPCPRFAILTISVSDHLRLEQDVVVPTLRKSIPDRDLAKARPAGERGQASRPTHPAPGKTFRGGNRIGRRLRAIYDRLRDYPPAEGASGRRGTR
jgi:hypothetical protein